MRHSTFNALLISRGVDIFLFVVIAPFQSSHTVGVGLVGILSVSRHTFSRMDVEIGLGYQGVANSKIAPTGVRQVYQP